MVLLQKSKDEHADIKDMRLILVQGAILEEGEGENREVIRQRVEGLNVRGNNNSLSIKKIRVSKHLSGEIAGSVKKVSRAFCHQTREM
jgi:hypothetical protein